MSKLFKVLADIGMITSSISELGLKHLEIEPDTQFKKKFKKHTYNVSIKGTPKTFLGRIHPNVNGYKVNHKHNFVSLHPTIEHAAKHLLSNYKLNNELKDWK